MPSEIYEVVAQGARYWFVFLMALIVWRSYRWYRRDRKQRKKRLRLLPDAGYVGEMVILSGGGELERGAVLPVPREGTLGFLRTNDLCVPAPLSLIHISSYFPSPTIFVLNGCFLRKGQRLFNR